MSSVKGNILLVEDDLKCANSLADFMKRNGLNVDICSTGSQAVNAISHRGNKYNIVILDMNLPDMSGSDVLQNLQANCPAVMVWTGTSSVAEQITVWNSGHIIDLIEKPTNAHVLLARVQNRLLTSKNMSSRNFEVKIGAIVFDLKRQVVSIYGSKLELSPKEYRLLAYLIQHSDAIVEKSMLMDHLYCEEASDNIPLPKILDVITCKIRAKIEALDPHRAYILTQWARGYTVPSIPSFYISSQIMGYFFVCIAQYIVKLSEMSEL